MNPATVPSGIALTALTAWLCRAVATPRWRYRQDETIVRSLALLGRRSRLWRLATALTILAFGALMLAPQPENADLRDLRRADASCGERESPYDPPTCYALLPGGQWAIEQVQADGTRQVIATVAYPPWKAGR